MNQTVRTVLMWAVIIVGVLLILQVLKGYSSPSREIPFSDFLDSVADGKVQQVLIKSEQIHIKTDMVREEPGGPRPRYDLFTYNPGNDDLIKDLREHNVVIKV